MLAPSEFGTIFPFFPLFLDKLWLYHLWRSSLCQATRVGSAVFDRRTGNLAFLMSIWLCSCLGLIYKHMSGSFKSVKTLPKFIITVVPVRETQASSSENCTTFVQQRCYADFPSEEGRAWSCAQILKPQAAFLLFCPRWSLLDINIYVKVLFVLFPTQTSSVSKGTSVENSLNSGMWNQFCSFD